MNLYADKLAGALERSLAPVYLIAGDEPLQQGEACDLVRGACRAAGYDERTVWLADRAFDWESLSRFGAALSLFAQQRLLELRLPGKPGRDGGKALQAYAAAPPADTVLLLVSPRLEPRARESAWFRALDRAGAVVQVWPVERERFPAWLTRRARDLDLQLEAEAATLLAERVENNMLAGAQELEKLRLLAGPGTLDADTVLRAVADSARFSVYDLADAVLTGAPARVRRALRGLREEGVEPTLVLWAVAREIRALALAAGALADGSGEEAALRAAGVWARRQGLFRRALARAADWQGLLREAATADRIIKGPGNLDWRALEALALRAAGCAVPGAVA